MAIESLVASGLTDDIKGHLQSWGIDRLTTIQRKALERGVADGRSMVVCAPTSAGKTLVAEIAVLKALQSTKRVVYLVSHKALADQKYEDFERKFGHGAPSPVASVALSTGDREEGELGAPLLVATYEKALALLLSGQIQLGSTLLVADELQIIGEPGRGPNIETLCAILRQRGIDQLIALTATTGNPGEIANWLECELVQCNERDVDLFQEIWSDGRIYSVKFGDEEGEEADPRGNYATNPLEVVRNLLRMGRGPVLMFTETRNEASRYAGEFSKGQARTPKGIELADQLDLFSEPTEASEQLQSNAQCGVAFHTTDLTALERQVVEGGFIDGTFIACFATSTLAAGVNFPFQSVVFPKLTYEYTAREGTHITRQDYRNMSGRAGRLGMHEHGYAILLPKNNRELKWANHLVSSENDPVNSQLVSASIRRTILCLIASRVIQSVSDIRAFFESTYYWYQISEHNPGLLDDIISKADDSIIWLSDAAYIECFDQTLVPTPLGKAVAQSGLLPVTAKSFEEMLGGRKREIEADFERFVPGLIHWACACGEFRGRSPTRFFQFPSGRNPVSSDQFLAGQALLAPLDRTDSQLNQNAHAIILYAQGVPERQIRFQTNIPSGAVHRLAVDIAWVLDGLQRIAASPELDCPQALTNKISMLARRVRWGVPPEALDIIRVAHRSSVPGFGRQRAMALLAQGLSTFETVIAAGMAKLSEILRSRPRAQSLLEAITRSAPVSPDRYARVHATVAAKLGLSDVVSACTSALGTEYEVAIQHLLEAETRWAISVIDDGKQQNVPDILIRLGARAILVECKTTTKNPPLIKKEEAFAVLQKSLDFNHEFRRVTLGKPGFDEHSKNKVAAAADVTLIEHSIFMEGVLRVLTGVISPEVFLDWLGAPGLAELDRLAGTTTLEIAQQ